MAKLDGKITFISGGTSGIGAETAKLFQSEGAAVIVTGSSDRSVEAAKAALPGIEVVVSNAGNVAATKVLVDQVKAKHGRIDVLFVNAGIAKFAPIAQVDEAFYDSQFNVNVKGAFFLLKHAIPIIPDGGAIILTASVAGAAGGLGGSTIYGSTKAALRSFGRTFAKDLTPRGIRSTPSAPARSSPRSWTRTGSRRPRRRHASLKPSFNSLIRLAMFLCGFQHQSSGI
jgi:NAD(P)-dependent dehydrogenase (short-subunit alcohol dehydrogenase family)